MPLPIIGAAVASGVSGVIGHLSNMSAQDRAQALQEKGVQEWLKVNIPDPAKMKLAMERFVSVGELVPELEAPLKAAETEFQKIKQDGRLRGTRMRALSSLEEQGYGGESAADAAAQEKAIIESGAANRGRQQAIVSDFQRRGQGGSGLELQARLDAQQAEGDRLSMGALDMEQARRMRALNAIAGAGELAGNMEEQDYRQKSDAARAADAIGLFNTQNAQGVMNRNVDRGNSADQWNLTNKQNTSDKNTALSNFEQQYNKELYQQDFDNRAKRAAGLSGQYGQQAAGEVSRGQSAAQMWGGIGQGVGKIALSAMDEKSKDEDEE